MFTSSTPAPVVPAETHSDEDMPTVARTYEPTAEEMDKMAVASE